VTIAGLRQEYEAELIGERIYARVHDLVSRAMRHRDPAIYGHGSPDRIDAVDEVLQDFVLDVLIRERQIDYIMTVSSGLEDFDRLMTRHVRRYLARTRKRTLIDNLIDRAVDRMSQRPFRAVAVGNDERFSLGGITPDHPVSDEKLRVAAAVAQKVPKDRSDAEARAPRIYDSDRLTQVLSILLQEGRGWVRRADLQRFFELLLTPWTVTLLDDTESVDVAARQLGPEQSVLVEDTVSRLVGALDEEARTILMMKSANLPDRDVANRLGVSRPTVAHRKAEVYATVRAELELVDPALHSHIVARLDQLLVAEDRS
jgi:hypothetical protein